MDWIKDLTYITYFYNIENNIFEETISKVKNVDITPRSTEIYELKEDSIVLLIRDSWDIDLKVYVEIPKGG